jgi:undecaprenyl-diphosphatase
VDWVDALVLGLVQGLTEFLPISSSGHLVLTQEVLGLHEPGAAIEIAVHLGTLLSVLVYYRADIVEIVRDVFRGGPTARLGWMVVVGTIPAVLVGLFLKDHIEAIFDSPRWAAGGLLATGAFVLLTPLARRRSGDPGFAYAVIVGCAQAIAILPGISRSGSTIGTAMFLGDDPVRAARFSFLLSIPAILGASVLLLADGGMSGGPGAAMLVASGVVAFASGLAAIAFLIKLLGQGRLAWFGPYCLIVGAIAWGLLS